METSQDNITDPLAADYARAVEQERQAWQSLQAQAPGSDERIRAWRSWSEAIVQTNNAWRRLNARRFAVPVRGGFQTSATRHANA
jgi:hypothetical protein